MPPKKAPAAEPVVEDTVQEPEVAIEQPAEAEAPDAEAEDIASADEVAVDEVVDEIDPELVEINAAVRPMRAADGSDASCDLYKSDKAGNILVPASDVPAMLEHGFVLVDDA